MVTLRLRRRTTTWSRVNTFTSAASRQGSPQRGGSRASRLLSTMIASRKRFRRRLAKPKAALDQAAMGQQPPAGVVKPWSRIPGSNCGGSTGLRWSGVPKDDHDAVAAEHRQYVARYIVGNAGEFSSANEYGLVVAAYLLNYASNRDELRRMCNGIARSLKRVGRFVSVNSSPSLNFATTPSYRQYGDETSVAYTWSLGPPLSPDET